MKTKLIVIRRWAALLLLLSILNPHLTTLFAQGTAFTYQGRLDDGANPANGNYDLTFSLYPSSSGGIVTAAPLTNSATAVSNGLFVITLDFGVSAFTGPARWLEISVRTNGSGGFSMLAPRQQITPTPYAIYAESASASALTGNIRTSNLSGNYNNALTFTNAGNNFAGNGGGLTNVNAATLGGLASSNFWKATGNAGIAGGGGNFVGTTDNQPLYFKVNGLRAFMLVPGGDSAADFDTNNDLTCSVIGGCSLNQLGVGVVGATIAGGGAPNFDGVSYVNWVLGDYGSVGGGMGNYASNIFTVVAGGRQNRASGQYATVGGGNLNLASDFLSTISGGDNNTASGSHSSVGGGTANTAGGASSTVGGGNGNNVYATDGTVGGGENNTANTAATVGGGANNSASGFYSTVGGGINNNAGGNYSTIPGGVACTAAGDYSFAAGKQAKANHQGAFVWADSANADFASSGNDQFLIRAAGGVGIGLNKPSGQLHVASASSNPQLQITQNNSSDYTRLRMNVLGSPSWEMDVSPGATPGISWWTGSVKMNLDYNGNLTTVGTVNGSSDRNVKEHFSPVSARDVLEKVSSLPITEWNYITDGETLRHIGPMAQDFYAAFNVGTDDKHISMVDADGVALAAIQGLNEKMDSENVALRAENTKLKQTAADLEHRLSALEQRLAR